MTFLIRVLRTLGLTLALLFIGGAAFAILMQDKYLYHPVRGAVGPSPGEEVQLTSADGVKTHGWYVSHPDAGITLLWFHGNGGNLENHRSLFQDFRERRWNILAIDYRGYGKSEGSPSEAGLYQDARAAYDWLLARTPAERIILYGESLGGAPACELASHLPCGGLILQSTFTSTADMAATLMPLFPARWFLRARYDTLSKIGRVKAPKLFLHSRADEIVPFAMGERLYEAAAPPKTHVWFDRVDHNSMWGPEHLAALNRFLEPLAK